MYTHMCVFLSLMPPFPSSETDELQHSFHINKVISINVNAERGTYLELDDCEVNLKQVVTLCAFQIGAIRFKMDYGFPTSMTVVEVCNYYSIIPSELSVERYWILPMHLSHSHVALQITFRSHVSCF